MKEEMNKILEERKSKHIEDSFGIEKRWNKIVEYLTRNMEDTIKYLKECSKEYLYYISEVFEDISEEVQSREFMSCLRELDKKYPDLDMTSDIDLAESYIL